MGENNQKESMKSTDLTVELQRILTKMMDAERNKFNNSMMERIEKLSRSNEEILQKVLQKMQILEESNEKLRDDQEKKIHSLNQKLMSTQRELGEIRNEKRLTRTISTDPSQLNNHVTNCIREFTLKHTFPKISEVNEARSTPLEYHYGVPWCVEIERKDGYLSCHLNCERSEEDEPWSIRCYFELRIIHPSGMNVSNQSEYCFKKRDDWGFPALVKWEKMIEEYAVDDQLTLEAYVKIIKTTGMDNDGNNPMNQSNEKVLQKMQLLEETNEKMKDDQEKKIHSLNEKLMSTQRELEEMRNEMRLARTISTDPSQLNNHVTNCIREFTLKHTFPNISEMNEARSTPLEYHYGVPWVVEIKPKDGYFACHLSCLRSEEDEPWSIRCYFELRIIHPNGKNVSKQTEHCFKKRCMYGFPTFLKWEKMIEEYAVDDQLTLEAYVKIIKTTGIEDY